MSIELYEAMSTLRAVRRLRPDPLPDDVLERILQAAAWAPSGGNVQPWRVVVVRDAGQRQALGDLYRPEWARYSRGARKGLANLSGEALAKQKRMLAAADHLGEHMGEAPVILVFCFNPDLMAITDADLGRPSVVGGGSVYPAVQNAMLSCRAEGVGCTLTTLLNRLARSRFYIRTPDAPPPVQCLWEDDAVDAVLQALHSRAGGAFNIGATEPRPWPELAGRHHRLTVGVPYRPAELGHRLLWHVTPAFGDPGWLAGMRYPLVVDCARAGRGLHWRANYSVADCVDLCWSLSQPAAKPTQTPEP